MAASSLSCLQEDAVMPCRHPLIRDNTTCPLPTCCHWAPGRSEKEWLWRTFSVAQGVACGEAGVTLISPFLTIRNRKGQILSGHPRNKSVYPCGPVTNTMRNRVLSIRLNLSQRKRAVR